MSRARKPQLTVAQVIQWAEAQFRETGKWPHVRSGAVHVNRNERWLNIDKALRMGLRGLAGGSSLARVLEKHRSIRNPASPPDLSVSQILGWADAHYARLGSWPKLYSGPIRKTNETWMAIDQALRKGSRGLPGGQSLALLLAQHRSVRLRGARLSERQILRWANAYEAIHKKAPVVRAGLVSGTAENWAAIDLALRRGRRGLQGGSSLASLLASRLASKGRKR